MIGEIASKLTRGEVRREESLPLYPLPSPPSPLRESLLTG